jgi:sulfite reductase (NADPH) flavoprotein alpha-component
MIMVGPGTGIAPFRAFLQERRAQCATGKNWLFFGDQRSATDFLYRDELEAMHKDGLLTRFDTAFSRDQPEKIYVQHRMRQQAHDLFAWLEAGAYFFVCGDASRMAKDVDAALHEIIQDAGARTPDEAAAYVTRLRQQNRYLRDVY